jgi:hypothetical protein
MKRHEGLNVLKKIGCPTLQNRNISYEIKNTTKSDLKYVFE